MNEAFSVVMSVYRGDDPKHFCEAFDSLLMQTRAPSEIVLVVDGPVKAELDESISRYAGYPGVRLLRLARNVGPGAARHEAVLATSTPIVAIMDSDDICMANRFEVEIGAMGSADLVGGYIAEFEVDPKVPQRIRKVPLTHEEIVRRGRWRTPFNHVTIMFRKEGYLRAGGYRSLRKVEDYDLFYRMFSVGLRFTNVPDVVVLVRASRAQYSRRQGLECFYEEVSLYRNMLHARYINRWELLRNVLIRIALRFIPPAMFGFISKIWLRSRNG